MNVKMYNSSDSNFTIEVNGNDYGAVHAGTNFTWSNALPEVWLPTTTLMLTFDHDGGHIFNFENINIDYNAQEITLAIMFEVTDEQDFAAALMYNNSINPDFTQVTGVLV